MSRAEGAWRCASSRSTRLPVGQQKAMRPVGTEGPEGSSLLSRTPAGQGEPRPVERIRRPRAPNRRALSVAERHRLAPARRQFPIKVLHEGRRGPVLDRAHRFQSVRASTFQKNTALASCRMPTGKAIMVSLVTESQTPTPSSRKSATRY